MRFLWLAVLAFAAHAAWLDDGIKALDEQRYGEAAAIFEKAAAGDPKDYVAHFHLGLAKSMLGESAPAISAYERTLELKPELAEAQLNLGILLAGENQHARAQELLGKALEKNPNAANGLNALGRSLMAEGKLEPAEAALAKAAALEPRYLDAVLELANEFEKKQNWAAAERLYAPQVANPTVAERLGVVRLSAGKPAEAIGLLEQAAKAQESAANRYALGVAYLRTKQPDAAAQQFARASAMEPGNLEMRLTYGRALRDQRKFAPAAEQFLAATKLKNDSREAWSELAGMLVMMENYQQGLTAYQRLEALGEKAAGLYFFKAICEDRLQLRKEALASYEQFLARSAGANPDQEFQARGRVQLLKRELRK